MEYSWIATFALGMIGWILKSLIARTTKAHDDQIKELKTAVETLKGSDINGRKELWEVVNDQREKLANLRGQLGKNGG